jgi:hypothetical protein
MNSVEDMSVDALLQIENSGSPSCGMASSIELAPVSWKITL